MKKISRLIGIMIFAITLLISTFMCDYSISKKYDKTVAYAQTYQPISRNVVAGVSQVCVEQLELVSLENQTVTVEHNNVSTTFSSYEELSPQPMNEEIFLEINDNENNDCMNIQPKYTQEELDTLAHLLFAEAGANYIDDKTIYYVGSVVMNRVNSSHYPNTVLEVIYDEGQYSPTWHGFMEKTPTERCYRIAQDILENGSILPANVLGQASKEIFEKYGKALYCISDGEYFFYL